MDVLGHEILNSLDNRNTLDAALNYLEHFLEERPDLDDRGLACLVRMSLGDDPIFNDIDMWLHAVQNFRPYFVDL